MTKCTNNVARIASATKRHLKSNAFNPFITTRLTEVVLMPFYATYDHIWACQS